jgi:phage pi2 protein 07
MALFNPSRDEVRDFFFDTWAKFRCQKDLSSLEKMTLDVIHLHPEYHAILDMPAQYKHVAYYPELGETNPFLHMSLHLSIREQLSINQPIGIVAIYSTLKTKYSNEHDAQHAILECLAETIWQAQRNNSGLDNQAYLHLLQQKVLK